MIYQSIRLWHEVTAWSSTLPVGLVLHSSCVNYEITHLRELAELPICWILPDDVLWELRLLRQSRLYGRQASFILECAETKVSAEYLGPSREWNLEQLYQTCQTPIAPKDIFAGTLLFAFGDLNKLEEFLKHTYSMPGHYVLVNSGWNCSRDNAAVYPLEKAKGLHIRTVRPLAAGKVMPALLDLERIECVQTGQQFPGTSFHFTGKNGGNARIYTCGDFPDDYVKIYNKCAMVGHYAQKLQKLTSLRAFVGNMSIALPEKLLTAGSEQVVGYTMMRCRGRPLREYICKGWDGQNLSVIFRNLILLLLELHCMHIIVNDLSYNNVLVDENGNVSLVDCDSFQVFHFPGGPITQTYRHPEVLDTRCRDTLREPRHEYFSFAVLAFQCLFYGDPLQQFQCADDDRQPCWDQMTFPLDVGGQSNGRANKAIEQIWNMQDEIIRQVFSDEFHFRSDNSLGVWIKTLELLS